MSKYSSSVHKRIKPKEDGPHVVWRGIGCMTMVIIPIISIAAGYETINYGLEHNWVIPYQLLGTPRFPDLFYRSSGLMTILSPIAATLHFYAYAVASFIYIILLGGISSLAYALAYRFVGPSRQNPLDAPRPNIKVKKYKR
jgi:hypothetical protein